MQDNKEKDIKKPVTPPPGDLIEDQRQNQRIFNFSIFILIFVVIIAIWLILDEMNLFSRKDHKKIKEIMKEEIIEKRKTKDR